MKLLLFIITLLILVACNDTKSSANPLLPTNLKYSAYCWYFKEKVDSFEFLLDHYIEIDKNGHFILMRQDGWRGKALYFSGHINDTIRKQIDIVFKNDDYKADYTWKVENNFFYDGFTYSLDYKNNNNERKLIQYIPNNSPKPINNLGRLLDTLIYKSAAQKSGTLNMDSYKNELKSLSQAMAPQPRIKRVKLKFFVPPKIFK